MNHNKIILIPSLQKEVVDYFKSEFFIDKGELKW